MDAPKAAGPQSTGLGICTRVQRRHAASLGPIRLHQHHHQMLGACKGPVRGGEESW